MSTPERYRRKVVVVEDDHIQSIALKLLLENLDYEVTGIFRTGEEVCSSVTVDSIDLIISDLRLDGTMTGPELIRKLREFGDTPAIFITGQNRHKANTLISDLPNSALLIKPIVIQEIEQVLEELDFQPKL
jgi:CheY-like chemotaxis protein